MEMLNINKAISNSYGKYFIAIITQGIESYAVWGADSTDGGNDKLLLDSAQRILLFKAIPDALRYIRTTTQPFFDEVAMKDWATACQDRTTLSNSVYDLDFVAIAIDSIQLADLGNANREDCSAILNVINLIGDYAYQTNNQQLLKLYRSKPVEEFSNYAYNTILWTVAEEELSAQRSDFDYPAFRAVIDDLVQSFTDRFLYYAGR